MKSLNNIRQWIGKQVRIHLDCPDWGGLDRNTTLLGIGGVSAIVYRPPEYGGYMLNDAQGKTHSSGWCIDPGYIELIEPAINVNPYPHKCNMCKSPARRCGNVTMCSNMRCGSRNQVSSLFNKYVPLQQLGNTSSEPIRLVCEDCGFLLHNFNEWIGCAEHSNKRPKLELNKWYEFRSGIYQYVEPYLVYGKQTSWKTIIADI